MFKWIYKKSQKKITCSNVFVGGGIALLSLSDLYIYTFESPNTNKLSSSIIKGIRYNI